MPRKRIVLYVLFFVFVSQTATHKIEKRWLFDLGSMIKCTTGRNALDYDDYGCYCGLGGSGTPIDGIDRCCQAHDQCYTDAGGVCGGTFGTYVVPYKWVCPLQRPYCSRGNTGCANALCACDVALSKCFGQYRYPKVKRTCGNVPWAPMLNEEYME